MKAQSSPRSDTTAEPATMNDYPSSATPVKAGLGKTSAFAETIHLFSLRATAALRAPSCGTLDGTCRPPGRRCDRAPPARVESAMSGRHPHCNLLRMGDAEAHQQHPGNQEGGLRWQVQPASPGTRSIRCSSSFPIGLWVFSFVADLVRAAGGAPFWADMAFYTMLAGLIGALAAAVPGLIDFLALGGSRVRRIATMHLVLNLGVVGLYVVNLWLRTTRSPETTLPIVLSAIGFVLLVISGWLGGELVYVHGVAVASEREIAIHTERRPQERSA